MLQWLGKVRLGKLGSMYFGETPSRMKAFSVGVKPLFRKSALKPSRDINIVVGAKLDVPFERNISGVFGGIDSVFR